MPDWVKTLVSMVIVPALVGMGSAMVSARIAVQVAAVERQWLRQDIDRAHDRIDIYHLNEGASYAASD